MRIAIDLSPVVYRKAGLGRYAGSLAVELLAQNRGDEFVAFSYGRTQRVPLEPPLSHLPQANVPLGARPWRLSVLLAHMAHISFDRLLPSKMDLFHATEHLLPPLNKSRTVFTLHDLIFQLYPEYHLPLNHRFLTAAMPRFLRRADAIIAVSDCTKRDAIRFYNIPPDKITVVYEGANPALRPVTEPDAIQQARARYAQTCPFILFVSTIEPRKNIPAVVDALRVLRDKGFPHRLVVAGRKGWLYEPVFEHVLKTGMHDRVDFLDYVPDADLRSLYAGCDAFVFPSLYEGFGLTPLEAMACGAPVICSNASSLPEVVGDAGILVDPRDVGALTEAIQGVITNESLRQDLRSRGIRQAAKFSWERAARETRSVYERVVQRQDVHPD